MDGPGGSTVLGSLEQLAIAAIDALPHTSVMVFDRDLRYLIVRGEALREQGVDFDLIEGRPAIEALGPARFAFYEPMYRAALEGRVTLREVPSLRGDQTYLIRVGPLRNAEGHLMGGVAVAMDITEQKRAEQWLTTLVNGAPDAVIVTDADGVILMVNERAITMFGFASEELVGSGVDLLVPTAHRSTHAGLRAAFLRSADPGSAHATVDAQARHKDGSMLPVEITLSTLRKGTDTLVCAAIRDVSERQRLQETSAFLAAVVRESDDAIIGGTVDGVLASWNHGAERLYGYTAEEAIGRPATMLSPDPESDEISEIVRRVSTGERVKVLETVRRRKDGSLVEVALSVSPVLDEHGRVMGISTIARDISEQLRHQQLLKDLAEHDPLTGAHNIRRLDVALGDQMERCRRYGECAVLLSLDLDDFKDINDTYGHHAGDTALKDLVAAVTPRLRATDILARVGGDEFVALIRHVDLRAGLAIAEELRSLIEAITVGGPNSTTHLAVSIGAVAIDDCCDVEQARTRADAALYAEKTRRGADSGSSCRPVR